MAAAAAWRTVFRDNLFAGKVAIVTGGGTGIGKAITKELSRLGCRVVIASRKLEKLQEAAEEINGELKVGGASGSHVTSTPPPLVFPFTCNIRNEEQVNNLIPIHVISFQPSLVGSGCQDHTLPFKEVQHVVKCTLLGSFDDALGVQRLISLENSFLI